MASPVGAFVPDSSALAGAVVAAGTVTSPSGAAVPGVTVDLYAWPSDAVLSAIKPGGLVPTTLLATATTSPIGTYTLRVPAARLKAAAVDSDYANLEIGSPAGIWFFPYQTGSPPARSSAPVTVNLGRKPPWPCGYDPQGNPYFLSRFTLLRHRAPAYAVVGQGYVVRQKQTAGDYVRFKYTQGASHAQASALGVGLSGYGLSAGYGGDGTDTSTATRSQGFAKAYGNAWFRTEFSTGQFRAECYGPPFVHVPVAHQHSPCPHKYQDSYVHKCLWLTHSTGWFGGTNTVYPGVPRALWQATARHTKKTATLPAIVGPLSGGLRGSALERRWVSRELT
jgi:hypothetical protein